MAKPGRKPKDAAEKMVTIALKVRPETKAKLDAMAEAEARTPSQMARFAIEDGIEVITERGLRTNGRRRRGGAGSDRMVRAVSGRRAQVQRFTADRLIGSKRRERDSTSPSTDEEPSGTRDPRPAA